MKKNQILSEARLLTTLALLIIPCLSIAGVSTAADTIRIGFLIQDNHSNAAVKGAELAVGQANEKVGIKGIPVKLVVRSMEGPWGTGSKQAVSLIFDEKVVALVGSHDGRNAHLVEQASAKARIVFISAWSSDPTLTQAFVPWFFNCVPNDIQQAEALIEEIYNKRKLTRIAVIADIGYDSQSALKNFLRKISENRLPEPLQFSYDNSTNGLNELLKKMTTSDISGVVILGADPSSLKIIEHMRQKRMIQPVFGSMSLLDENKLTSKPLPDFENTMFISSVNLTGKKGLAFSEEFKRTYGILPGNVASFAYDGMNILIEAIRKSGIEREDIQKYMYQTSFEGATGIIRFDEKGNRKGSPGFVEIKNGILIPIIK